MPALALLPWTRPAAAQTPTRDLAPPAVLARPVVTPVATPLAHPSVMPVKPPPRLALAPAPAPMRGPPSAPPPLPDRARQLIELQTVSRAGPPPRPLTPLEATAIWKNYTARIGKPPSLSGGSGSSGGSAGGGSGSSGGSQ